MSENQRLNLFGMNGRTLMLPGSLADLAGSTSRGYLHVVAPSKISAVTYLVSLGVDPATASAVKGSLRKADLDIPALAALADLADGQRAVLGYRARAKDEPITRRTDRGVDVVGHWRYDDATGGLVVERAITT